MLQVNPIIGIMVALSLLSIGPSISLTKDQDQMRTCTERSLPGMEIKKLTQGVWGGPHIIMEVDANGAALTYDCAVGTIDGPITLGNDGRFSVHGTLTRQRSGSIRSGETSERSAALYSGRVDNKSMTLLVTLPKTNETAGTFYLTYGEQPELTRCMS